MTQPASKVKAMSLQTLDIPAETEWHPPEGDFQIFPEEYPRIARHSILHATNWVRVADKIYDAYGLYPVGNDGKRWMYFA